MFIKPHEFIRRADKICSAFILLRLRISLSVPCSLHLQGICLDLYCLSLYGKASFDRFIPGTGDDIIISSCRKCVASICLCLQILTWPLLTGHCDHRCDLFAISRSNITKCHLLLCKLCHGDTLCIRCFIASHREAACLLFISKRFQCIAVRITGFGQAVGPSIWLRSPSSHRQFRICRNRRKCHIIECFF